MQNGQYQELKPSGNAKDEVFTELLWKLQSYRNICSRSVTETPVDFNMSEDILEVIPKNKITLILNPTWLLLYFSFRIKSYILKFATVQVLFHYYS